MMVGWISSLALRDTSRSSITRTQARLERTAVEASTGRHYDVGRALGSAAAGAIDLRNEIGELDAIRTTNEIASGRLAASQSALSAMADLANGFFAAATAAAQSGADRALLVEDARGRLATLRGLLAATSNGAFVFSEANVAVAPLADYGAQAQSAARAGVIAAFTAEFGVAPEDSQAAAITPAQMQTYLDGAFASLFQDPAWQASFSSASGGPVGIRLSPSEIAQDTASANDPGVRRLVSTLVAAIDSGAEGLNAETFQAFVGTLARGAAEAAAELTHCQAATGVLQDRLAQASERMLAKQGLLQRALGGLESVDQSEASITLNDLTRQLEVSYAITARMQKLSLLDYL